MTKPSRKIAGKTFSLPDPKDLPRRAKPQKEPRTKVAVNPNAVVRGYDNRKNLRHGMTAGDLPPGCKYIELRLNAFRRQLEDACIAAKGTISMTDAALINTALKWERHGALAQRWLTKKNAELSANDQLRFSSEMAKASDNRDKAIRSLNLDVEPETIDLKTYVETKRA